MLCVPGSLQDKLPVLKQSNEVEQDQKAAETWLPLSLQAFPSRRDLCPQGFAAWPSFRSGPKDVLSVVGFLLNCYQKVGSPFSLPEHRLGKTLLTLLAEKKTHLGFICQPVIIHLDGST